MSEYSIDLSSKDKWVKCLNRFENLDFHFYPDYHDLYNSRYKNSDSFLWVYENKEKIFLYPFHKTKIKTLEELTIKFAREVLRLFFKIDYHSIQNIYHL